MKLHASIVEKLIKIYETNGGFQDYTKLRRALSNLDLTPYERKQSNNNEMVLVLTEDYLKELSGKKQ